MNVVECCPWTGKLVQDCEKEVHGLAIWLPLNVPPPVIDWYLKHFDVHQEPWRIPLHKKFSYRWTER